MKEYEYNCDWGHAVLQNHEEGLETIPTPRLDDLEVIFEGKKGKLHLGVTTSSQGGHGIGYIDTPHYFIAFEDCSLYRVGNGDKLMV